MEKKRVLILGATGMVGGHALDYCLKCPDVARVTIIVRKSTGKRDQKLTEVFHDDFLDYSAIEECLACQDVALYCIGVYTGSVPEKEFKKVTIGFTKAFSDALLANSPEASICFLSGAGADREEKSRVMYARAKGKAENILLRGGFKSVHLFRPQYIYPVEPRKEPNLLYGIQRVIWPVIGKIVPKLGIYSDKLGHSMAHVGIYGGDKETYENVDILELAKTLKC